MCILNVNGLAYAKADVSYSLMEATDKNEEGVSVNTQFILRDKNMTEESLKTLRIEPDVPYTYKKVKGELLITFSEELKENTLYTWYYSDKKLAFQTQKSLEILGSLPGDEATYVPTESTIEFYFNKNVEGKKLKEFKITPKVTGEKVIEDNKLIFMPKADLAEGTVYTVKMTFDDLQPYTVKFETAKKEMDETRFSFGFRDTFNEIIKGDGAGLQYYYYTQSDKPSDLKAKVEVYRYKDVAAFQKAFSEYNSSDTWATTTKPEVKTNGLSKTTTIMHPLNAEDRNDIIPLPDDLKSGGYVVVGTVDGDKSYTFVQVTNNGYYTIKDDEKSIYWVKDLKTSKSLSNAVIMDQQGKKYKANKDGIIEVPVKEQKETNYYTLVVGSEKSLIIDQDDVYSMSQNKDSSSYFHLFQTDKPMYQPGEALSFWGFVNPRSGVKMPKELTLTIGEEDYFRTFSSKVSYGFPQSNDPLYSQKIDLKNNAFEGNIKLPVLDSGYYQLMLKDGEHVIARRYVEIRPYVKPAFKVSIDSDKKGIMLGDSINFTINADFYEGTPVANLQGFYSIYGYNRDEGEFDTDANGKATLSFTPSYIAGTQGVQYYNLYTTNQLPESAEIRGNKSVVVFVNDMNMNVVSEKKENDYSITGELAKIDVKKFNLPESDADDYLGEPVNQHKVEIEVMQHHYEKIVTGREYDAINKTMVDITENKKISTIFKTDVVYSNAKGEFNYSFKTPKDDQYFYNAEVKTKDLKDKEMNDKIYFYDTFIYDKEVGYELKTSKETYRVNEDIQVNLQKDNKQVSNQEVLFALATRGLQGYEISSKGEYKGNFKNTWIPNASLYAVTFEDGKFQRIPNASILFDTESKKVDLSVEVDKKNYKPGDKVLVKLSSDALKKGTVHLGLIDEAYLDLRDISIDTLKEYYALVPSGIVSVRTSHGSNNFFDEGVMFYGARESSLMVGKADNMAMDTAAAEPKVRDDFQDIAIYKMVQLNEKGEGELTFTLPDNITSWKVFAQGISIEGEAATELQSVPVSLPFFINTALSGEILTDDQASIGVSGFGTAIDETDKVKYTLSNKEMGYKKSTTAKGFEKAYLSLPKLKEGSYNFTLVGEVTTADGKVYSDALQVTVNSTGTHRVIKKAETIKIYEGYTLPNQVDSLVELTIVNENQGKYLPALYSLSYQSGRRIDQSVISILAKNEIAKLKEDGELIDVSTALSQYYKGGGMALLGYGEQDLQTTINMLPLIHDKLAKQQVVNYLMQGLSTKNDTFKVLYGLSYLGAPILNELDTYSRLEGRTLENNIYLALAYAEIGQEKKALEVYNQAIKDSVKTFGNKAKVEHGDQEMSLYLSAELMLLASKMDLPVKEQLFAYVSQQRSKEELYTSQLLSFVQWEMEKLSPVGGSLTYSYDGKKYTLDVSDGYSKTIKVLPNIKDGFKVLDIQGEVTMVLLYDEPINKNIKNDKDLSVTRTYEVYGTNKETKSFNTTDLVKVVIKPEINSKAVDGYYKVTDYVPSGLAPINNESMRNIKEDYTYYRHIDGRKVSFYISKEHYKGEALVYYARVVAPGTYKGEGVIIQGTDTPESLFIGEDDTITISK